MSNPAVERSADQQVRNIPLIKGGTLRLEPLYSGAPEVWKLYRGDSEIRALDVFEAEFVNSAIRAATSPGQPYNPKLTGLSG